MALPGGTEWIWIIIAIAVLVFGAKKIPELAQGVGKGMREFKKALNDVQEEVKNADKIDDKK